MDFCYMEILNSAIFEFKLYVVKMSFSHTKLHQAIEMNCKDTNKTKGSGKKEMFIETF